MQTFRQKFKRSLTLCLFIVTFSSYGIVFAEPDEKGDPDTGKAEHHVPNNIWSGVYLGFLPCEDCKGIKTSLALNKNNSYILIIQYVGKSEREIVEKGKFALGDQDNTIILTPRKSTQTRQYFIGDNTLTQLDNDGNHITGEHANRYILRKTEMTDKNQSSTHH
jgi:copper homeostasis protein (lipoprotein)